MNIAFLLSAVKCFDIFDSNVYLFLFMYQIRMDQEEIKNALKHYLQIEQFSSLLLVLR